MKTVERAVQTFDLVLWEAVARVCGKAYSRAFQRRGNSVRVVYETESDPRECFGRIRSETGLLISGGFIIHKLGKEARDGHSIMRLSSRNEYCAFFFDAVLPEENPLHGLFECDFVVIQLFDGTLSISEESMSPEKYISCPSVSEFLRSTDELRNFEIELIRPKRVGKDRYEFRFVVEEY